jgi:hypothetical protein
MEQPRVLRDTIHSALAVGENKRLIDSLDISAFNKILNP